MDGKWSVSCGAHGQRTNTRTKHAQSHLDANNLVTNVVEVRERRLGHNGEDEHEALAVLHVQIAHGRELLRSGRVENLQQALNAIN